MAYASSPKRDMVVQSSSPIYDAMLFTDKPDLTSSGLKPWHMAYEGELFPPGGNDGGPPNEAKVRQRAQQLIASGYPVNEPVGLDVEGYPWNIFYATESVVTQSMGYLAQIIDWFKNEAPAYTKVGFYSIGPVREWWPAQQGPGSQMWIDWQAANTFLAPIIAHKDILIPSLYTFYDDEPGWVTYANANMDEAVRIGGGRQIYPFLWPRYTDTVDYIDYDYWTLQLNTLTAHPGTSGIVIWGGVSIPESVFDDWSAVSAMPWWQATLDFIGASAARGAKRVA